MHEFRMLLQVRTQTGCVTGIDQIHSVAKNRIFDSFMVRQIQLIRQRRFFDMPFESCPAWKSSLAGDYELRVTKLQVLRENVIVRGAMEARMKFPDALRRSRVARSMRPNLLRW